MGNRIFLYPNLSLIESMWTGSKADRLPRGGLRGDQAAVARCRRSASAPTATIAAFAVGAVTLPSLAELRARTGGLRPTGRPRLVHRRGRRRAMHALPANAGALFQVASQFNTLEMVAHRRDARGGRDVATSTTARRGRPARWRPPRPRSTANYLVPVGGGTGQTASAAAGRPRRPRRRRSTRRLGPAAAPPWAMRDGYAMATLGAWHRSMRCCARRMPSSWTISEGSPDP